LDKELRFLIFLSVVYAFWPLYLSMRCRLTLLKANQNRWLIINVAIAYMLFGAIVPTLWTYSIGYENDHWEGKPVFIAVVLVGFTLFGRMVDINYFQLIKIAVAAWKGELDPTLFPDRPFVRQRKRNPPA
jgi:hypothetical protein